MHFQATSDQWICIEGRIWGFQRFWHACIALASPEEELESADKGPEIIVPLYLLERVQSQAAKNLQFGESEKHSPEVGCNTACMSALILLENFYIISL